MRRKVVVEIDEAYNLHDSNGTFLMTATASNSFEEFVEPPQRLTNIAELIGLGVTPDDLLKLKASGIIV